ncbi:MAG: hypothetical protein K8U03_07720 [Planctomycetia bacterium]|nr:hypothetical protein [Planctomycetia bacterium]
MFEKQRVVGKYAGFRPTVRLRKPSFLRSRPSSRCRRIDIGAAPPTNGHRMQARTTAASLRSN